MNATSLAIYLTRCLHRRQNSRTIYMEFKQPHDINIDIIRLFTIYQETPNAHREII